MMRPERLTDGYGSPRAVLGRPLVSRDFWGCASAGGSRQRVRSLRYAARPTLGGEPPARPRWCDQISTPAENPLYPYSEHSCAHRHSHDFGKLFGD